MLVTIPFRKTHKLLGKLPNGQSVHSYYIQNSNGMSMNVLDYGATVTHLWVPINNDFSDVVLGFNKLQNYIDSFSIPGSPYFGAIVGRVAGRIANATYKASNTEYKLSVNHGLHQLHGGVEGFSQKVWELKQLEKNKVTFYYLSKDGEEGFPGNLHVTLTYEITEDNTWNVIIDAHCDEDTVLNLTQHAYFNLDDNSDDLSQHQLKLQAQQYIETKDDMIPTGNFLNTTNTVFDFENFTSIPSVIDNTFLNVDTSKEVASLQCLSNKLEMKVYTNQPGTHIYVGGKCATALEEKTKATYNAYSGICFETQHFPDSVNHQNFPSIELKKGAFFKHETSFKFQEIK